MRVDVLTLFPEMFADPLGHSILGRAIERGLLEVQLTNPRDFTTDRHRTVDDYPYGGGPGMVMKAGPIFAAVESLAEPDDPIYVADRSGRRRHPCDARQRPPGSDCARCPGAGRDGHAELSRRCQ